MATSNSSEPPSASPSPSPSKLHLLQGTTWMVYNASSNLERYPSLAATFPRETPVIWPNVILWNDMDATVEIICEDSITSYACEYVLKSSIRIMHGSGYTGVRIYSVYDEDGADKVLVVDEHYLWVSPTCTYGGRPCELLQVTDPADGVTDTAYLEYRMGIYPNVDNRTAPFVVEWIDETLVAHGLRPSIGNDLERYEPYQIPVGDDFGISDFFNNEQSSLVVGMMAGFTIALLSIMVYSCCRKPVVKKSERKLRYIVDTGGLRTIMKNARNQLKRSETQSRNKLSPLHAPFIIIIIIWRCTYSLVFTMTFFAYVFSSINHEHYSTMDNWEAFSADRDSQILALMSDIEVAYGVEKSRIDREWAYTEQLCNVSSKLESAYISAEDSVESYHDLEQASRRNGEAQSGTAVIHLSTTKRCDISDTSEFVMNSIQMVDPLTGGPSGTPWDVANLTLMEIREGLREACEADNSCIGFSYNSGTGDYYLFNAFPEVDTLVAGFCSAIIPMQIGWPEGEIDRLNEEALAEYQSEVNQTYDLYNSILEALRTPYDSGDGSSISIIFDDTGYNSSFRWGQSDIEFFATQGQTPTLRSRIWFLCPNCDPLTMPIFSPYSAISSYNGSNSNYTGELNTTWDFYSYFIDEASKQVNVTEADYTWLEPPNWEWDFYQIKITDRVLFVAVSLDIILLCYRTLYTVALVAKYVQGLERIIPLHYVGIDAQGKSVAEHVACAAIPCLAWFGKKLKRLDNTLWELMRKLMILLNLVLLFCICFVAYWVVDNLVQLETFEQFGVFSTMTAAPSAQQTLRNEQLAGKAFAYSLVADATFKKQVDDKAEEILNRQIVFNEHEFNNVAQFNTDYCAAMKDYVGASIALTATSTSIAACCPSGHSLDTTFTFDLGADGSIFSQDVSNIVAEYIVNTIEVKLRWMRPSADGCVEKTDAQNWAAIPATVGVELQSASVGGGFETLYSSSTYWDVSEEESFYGQRCEAPDTNSISKEYVFIPGNFDKTLTIRNIVSSDVGGGHVIASRLTLDFNSSTFGSDYMVIDVDVYGQRLDDEEFECNEVEWQELDFDFASIIGQCQSLYPVSAHMVSLFNRADWTRNLTEAHTPFINAMRNIVLSPFYIGLAGLAILIIVMLFLALLEYFMLKADMIRQNTFVKVPCVIAKVDVDLDSLELTGRQTSTRRRSSVLSAAKSMLDPRKSEFNSGKAPRVHRNSSLAPTRGNLKPIHGYEDAEYTQYSSELRSTFNEQDAIDDTLESDASLTDRGLAPNWLATRTPSGEIYYYNESTNETSWDRPVVGGEGGKKVSGAI